MVRTCAVSGCHIRYCEGEGLSFHRFPHDPATSAKWVSLSGNKRLLGKTIRELVGYSICTTHFPSHVKHSTPTRFNSLKRGAVPSLKLPTPLSVLGYDINSDDELQGFILTARDDATSPSPPSLPHPLQLRDASDSEDEEQSTISKNGDGKKVNVHLSQSKNMLIPQSPEVRNLELHSHADILEDCLLTADHVSMTTTKNSGILIRSTPVCRLCCKCNEDVIDVFGAEGCERDLVTKINSSLPIEVTTQDKLPKQVCINCVQKLETAYELRETCTVADLALKLMFSDTRAGYGNDEILTSSDGQLGDYEDEQPMDISYDLCPSPSSHINEVNEDPKPPLILCHVCNAKFDKAKNFMVHMNNLHHMPSVKCKSCLMFFSSKKRLADHTAEIHSEKLLAKKRARAKQRWISIRSKANLSLTYEKCQYCEISLPCEDKAAIKKHRADHLAKLKARQLLDSNIKCEKCNCKFLTEKSKLSHQANVHKLQKEFKCEHCGKEYNLKTSYLIHLRQHNSYAENENVLCEHCGKSFDSKRSLYCHVVYHRKEKCSICNKILGHNSMKRHVNFYHYKDRKIRCALCSHSFFTEKELEQHKLCHENSQYECYVCGTLFKNVENFFSHTQSHQTSLSKYLTCPVKVCRTQFTSAEDFIRHCDSHSNEDLKVANNKTTGEKIHNFLCSFCDRSFRYLQAYTDHLTMHGEVLSTCCNICQTSLDSVETLTQHLETHPEAFDFNCHHCKQVFVTDKQRTDHEITMHQEGYQCDVCSKIVSDSMKFRLHKSLYCSSQGNVCKVCGKKFSRNVLKKHMLTHSKD